MDRQPLFASSWDKTLLNGSWILELQSGSTFWSKIHQLQQIISWFKWSDGSRKVHTYIIGIHFRRLPRHLGIVWRAGFDILRVLCCHIRSLFMSIINKHVDQLLKLGVSHLNQSSAERRDLSNQENHWSKKFLEIWNGFDETTTVQCDLTWETKRPYTGTPLNIK